MERDKVGYIGVVKGGGYCEGQDPVCMRRVGVIVRDRIMSVCEETGVVQPALGHA